MTFDEMMQEYGGGNPNAMPNPPMPWLNPPPDEGTWFPTDSEKYYMYGPYEGGDPNEDMGVPLNDMIVGAGAQSSNIRQLAPRTEPIRTPFLRPNFADSYWKMAQHPWATGINLASKAVDYGQNMVSNAFQPAPPGTDPFSVRPQDLMRQLREGIMDDESIAAIRENPTGPRALAAYAQAAIMLSRGAGGKAASELPKVPIPESVWNSYKLVGKSGGGEIRVDHAGNHYKPVGSQIYNNEGTGERMAHVIAQPVEQPGYKMGPEDNLPVKMTPQEAAMADEGVGPVDWGWYKPQEGRVVREPKPDDPAYQEWQEYKASQEPENPFNMSKEEMDQLKKEFMDETDPIFKDMDQAHADYLKKWGTWDDIPPADKAKIAKEFGGEMGMDEGDKAAAAKAHFNPQAKYPEPPQGIGDDFPQMPPGVKPGEYWKQPPEPPPEPGSPMDEWSKLHGGKQPWGDANDRKYSGPLEGQQWADIYATPDMEFTVGPKDPTDAILPRGSDESPAQWWHRYTMHRLYEPPGTQSPNVPEFKPPTNEQWHNLTPEQQQWYRDMWKQNYNLPQGWSGPPEDLAPALDLGSRDPNLQPPPTFQTPPVTNFPKNWHELTPEQQQFFLQRWGYKPPPDL